MNNQTASTKSRGFTITGTLWIMIIFSLFQAARYSIELGRELKQTEAVGLASFDLIVTLLAQISLGVAFFAILRWKKWGAYLLILTILTWVGIYTVSHGRSLIYFSAVTLVFLTIASITFIFSWDQLE